MLTKLLITFLLIHLTCGRELKFVQAIWRHGDRAPGDLAYPTDVYVESYWPLGWSQLTERGVEQLEELGKFFRDRYVGSFTSGTYKPSEVFIQSSDEDRALVSAQSFANGMFNLLDCSANTRTTPIPIHSTGVGLDDYLLKPTSTDCPAYDQLFEATSVDLITNIEATYKELFAFLGNVTGIGAGITADQVADVSNVQREIDHNLAQPDWVHQIWPEYNGSSTLELVTLINSQLRIDEFDDPQLAKLRGGYLLGDWLIRAKNVSKNELQSPSKMMLYSSHDGTLLSLLYAMEIGDGESVPYAACVIMEIYEDNNESIVELFYQKNNETIPKTVPGCESPCTVDKLMQVLEKNAVYDRAAAEKQCQISKSHGKGDKKSKSKHHKSKGGKTSSSSSSESDEKDKNEDKN